MCPRGSQEGGGGGEKEEEKEGKEKVMEEEKKEKERNEERERRREGKREKDNEWLLVLRPGGESQEDEVGDTAGLVDSFHGHGARKNRQGPTIYPTSFIHTCNHKQANKLVFLPTFSFHP